jgi:hypothetical protein
MFISLPDSSSQIQVSKKDAKVAKFCRMRVRTDRRRTLAQQSPVSSRKLSAKYAESDLWVRFFIPFRATLFLASRAIAVIGHSFSNPGIGMKLAKLLSNL